MKKTFIGCLFMVLGIVVIYFNSCDNMQKQGIEDELINFIKGYEAKVAPLSKEISLTYFNASISGKEEDFDKCAKLQVEMNKIFTNKEDFATLKKIRESLEVSSKP